MTRPVQRLVERPVERPVGHAVSGSLNEPSRVCAIASRPVPSLPDQGSARPTGVESQKGQRNLNGNGSFPSTPPSRTRGAANSMSRGYPAAMLARACELHTGGWEPGEIRHRLQREFGFAPTTTTIRVWVDPLYRQERLARDRDRKDKARRAAGVAQIVPSGGPIRTLTDDVLWALRIDDELSHSAISRIARRFYAVELTANQIRGRLEKLGAPKNPNKATARRRAAA